MYFIVNGVCGIVVCYSGRFSGIMGFQPQSQAKLKNMTNNNNQVIF